MKALPHISTLIALLALAITGCQDLKNPVEASSPAQEGGPALTKDKGGHHGDGDHSATFKAHLKAMVGHGKGRVRVTPITGTTGFSAQIEVEVKHLPPNATFFLQRAPEIGRPMSSDGIGQRALGLYPWEQPNSPGFPPAPAFITFPLPGAGPLVMITTDANGEGEVEFLFEAASIADGTLFDVVFRVVDNPSSPSTDLWSNCFTVTVL
jgi:hypothetical protein